MTHSGGKPHTNVGDRGQRYEVRATGYPKEALEKAAKDFRYITAIQIHPRGDAATIDHVRGWALASAQACESVSLATPPSSQEGDGHD